MAPQTDPGATETSSDDTAEDAHIDMSRVDEAELFAIQAQRAFSDPYIIHDVAQTRGYGVPDAVKTDIDVARFQQHQDTPLTQPVRKATWPEVSIYFSTLSLVQPLDSDGADMYLWAFAKHMVETRGLTVEDVENISGTSVTPPDEHLWRKLAGLRQEIKADRDKHYLKTQYPAESTVPKRYWTAWHTSTATVDEAEYQLDTLGGDN